MSGAGLAVPAVRPVDLGVEGMTLRIGGRAIVDDVSFRASGGELVALVGPNGVGKTSLLKAMLGLVPASGRVTVDGVDLATHSRREWARAVGYLPQGHESHWPLTVRDIVALGRFPHGGKAGDAANADAVLRAMAVAGVSELAERPVTRLSGGEQARVALARALAVEAPILFADEPIASLDPRYQLVIMQLLRDLAHAGRLVVAVLHDLALVSRFADRVLVMQAGQVVADGAPDIVLDDALLADVFGIAAKRGDLDGARIFLPWRAV